jgi:hypothetical protein
VRFSGPRAQGAVKKFATRAIKPGTCGYQPRSSEPRVSKRFRQFLRDADSGVRHLSQPALDRCLSGFPDAHLQGLFLHPRIARQLCFSHEIIPLQLAAQFGAELLRGFLLVVFHDNLDKQIRPHRQLARISLPILRT